MVHVRLLSAEGIQSDVNNQRYAVAPDRLSQQKVVGSPRHPDHHQFYLAHRWEGQKKARNADQFRQARSQLYRKRTPAGQSGRGTGSKRTFRRCGYGPFAISAFTSTARNSCT